MLLLFLLLLPNWYYREQETALGGFGVDGEPTAFVIMLFDREFDAV